MKRFLLIIGICLALGGEGFAVGSVVQKNLGGNASGTSACSSGITATGNYASNTTAGSTLALVIWGSAGTSSIDPFTFTPATSGVTWTHNSSAIPVTHHDSANSLSHALDYWWAIGAGSVGSGTNTSVSASISSASSCKVEFALFELAGITSNALDSGHIPGFGTSSSTPSASTLNTEGFPGTYTYFVLASFGGEGSTNLTAGSGFTLGETAVSAIVGQSEYAGGVTISQAIAFTGTNPYWLCGYVAFVDGVVSSSIVPRHRGWVF